MTPTFAPGTNSLGKSVAGGILAPTVQHDLDSVVWNGARQRDRFFGYAAIRFTSATLLHLDNIETAQPQQTSSLEGAIPIAFGKLTIGARLEPANRGDHNPHQASSGVAALTCVRSCSANLQFHEFSAASFEN